VHDGWRTSRGYKYSRLRCGGRRLLRHGVAKNARCARVFAPRSASLCLFRPFPTRPGPPEFSTRSDGGSRGFTEPHPTFSPSLCPLAPSHSAESPDTLRPTCQPTSPRATADTSDQPNHVLNIPILIFLVSQVQRRSSDLSITCILGQHACTTTRTKHVALPVTRPQTGFFTKHHESLSGQLLGLRAPSRCLWCSSQPPLAFVFPRRPCLPPPARSTFHRDHHMPIPSSHVHLSTTTYLPMIL
jgi:hypothetical protein